MANSTMSEERDNSIAIYFGECKEYPLLTRLAEIDLFEQIERARGDDDERRTHELKAEMVQHNLRLVIHVANNYRNSDVPFLDLIQEGNLGLMRTVEKFETKYGTKFVTYAHWWIRQTISRAVHEQARTVRFPSHMIENGARLRKAENQFHDDHGREPNLYELAECLGWDIDKTILAMRSLHTEMSLNHQTTDSREAFSNKIAHDECPDAESLLEQAQRARTVGRLSCDPPRT